MLDSLKTWRQAVGGLTLLIACAVMAVWVRGYLISDIIDLGFQGGGTIDSIQAVTG